MKYLLLIAFLAGFLSCKKVDEYLDYKYNLNDKIPNTIADYQAILDYNTYSNSGYPQYGVIVNDNYYMVTSNYLTMNENARRAYTWEPDFWGANSSSDWNQSYLLIERCNIVLDGLEKINPTISEISTYNNVKGSALFLRGFQFYYLVIDYSQAYGANNLNELGIPLRINSDVNIQTARSTVKESYEKIISDLLTAADLLPDGSITVYRPSKQSAYALLARVYLQMGDYANASNYASKSLALYSYLENFNSLSTTASVPFGTQASGNGIKEIVFFSSTATLSNSPTLPSVSSAFIDTFLYSQYDNNDLRKTIFYTTSSSALKQYKFKGSYTGSTNNLFAGLAVNEVYFIRSEAYARQGKITDALADLNKVVAARWKTGTFIPFTATTAQQALDIILTERRKEFPFTSTLRWADIKRLNLDPNYAITLKRVVNNQTYTLPANDKRYAFLIPLNEIQLSGLVQNPR